MKKIIVIVISNNYADWEIAFISSELNKLKDEFKVVYVSLSNEKLTSIGGLRVTPDYSIGEYLDLATSQNITMLILCGGTFWKEEEYKIPEVNKLVDYALQQSITVGAICDSTTFLAYNSYLNSVKHTGNSLDYIKSQCLEYTNQDNFVEKQCILDNNIITANGTSNLEFSREIFKLLNVSFHYYSVDDWYSFNKVGLFKDK